PHGARVAEVGRRRPHREDHPLRRRRGRPQPDDATQSRLHVQARAGAGPASPRARTRRVPLRARNSRRTTVKRTPTTLLVAGLALALVFVSALACRSRGGAVAGSSAGIQQLMADRNLTEEN